MDDLRLPLLIIGFFAIIGVTAHGLWTSRKNARRKNQREAAISAVRESNQRSADAHQQEDFDDLGVGPVRVISRTEPTFEQDETVETLEDDIPVEQHVDEAALSQPEPQVQPEQQAQAVTANRPQWMADDDIPEPPSSLLKQPTDARVKAAPTTENVAPVATPTEEKTVALEKESLADKARKLVRGDKASPKATKRKEPRVAEDQLRIDFDDEPQVAPQNEQKPRSAKQDVPAEEQQVLVLNVKMPDGKVMSGAALLPVLLTLGFKFGAQDIFHRHVNSNGKGPVLFSLANMFKPGIFDVDNMENFNTQGVSLFMILPIEGDPHQVFNMMHNAARKIAEEFDAQILDGRRSVLTKQGLQQYIEKIRESERRRMLTR